MIVVQTPLRVSFVGGGTDFEDFYSTDGGAVLSAAIDKYVFVIVKERFDDMICINYSERESAQRVADLRHELVREAMKMTGVERGVEITTLADVPSEGTGLDSSSSITVALLQALHTYQGEIETAKTLAEEACRIEIDILGKPIGKQDQYIAAYGNMRFINFNSHGVEVEKVGLPREERNRLSTNLMLLYTGITRSSSRILSQLKANMNDSREVLSQMKELVIKASDALTQGAFDDFGLLLHRNWELKKQLARDITIAEIDGIYEAACKAGAIGGKICGSGGGGFLLLYCPNGKQEEVRRTLKLRELPFKIESDGSKVILNYRRG